MSEYETVNVRREGAAATIELNRPETLNAWNAQLGHDLLAAVTAVAEDDAVRAVVITGRRARLLGRRRPTRPLRPRGRARRRASRTCAGS